MVPELDRLLMEPGYAFVASGDMCAAIAACGPLDDWNVVAETWNDLDVDPYRTTGDRRRRYGVFTIDRRGAIVHEPHQPHYQRPEYNRLFGGVERWFAPILDATARSRSLTTLLRYCDGLFRRCAPATDAWHVELHQFRIEARADAPGQPTPEGVHRDGVDFVLVLLVNRDNIVSGTTTVYDPGGHPLGSFTLSRPFDAALLDDHRVAHGVTAVAPLDPSRPGYRDVLVVTFRDL
jgi:hypothetical protein